MPPEPLVLGIDGGGTKTLAVLADRSGAVHHVGHGRDTNPLDQPAWRDHLAAVVQAALAQGPVAAAAVGLPAHDEVESASHAQREFLAAILPAPTSLRNDVHTAHEGAFVGQAGVLLLAGTGSMCWASDGVRQLRVGGWGGGFGDEGSAAWIGREALARASRVLDGRLSGAGFAARLLAAIGVAPARAQDGMIAWYYDNPNRRPAVAALAVAVDGAAEAGDALAATLLDDAAEALALHVTTARRRLDLPAAWCFVGGVSRSARVRAGLARHLGAPSAPLLPPVGGAVWRAATEAGWRPDAAWIARLGRTLAQHLEAP